MKVYQICEILNTDSVFVNDSDNNMLLHIEGENAVNAVAQLYEHCTVKRVTPTKYSVEIQIEE